MIIYYLKNKINGKGYIGYDTKSLKEGIQHRYNGHIKLARRNKGYLIHKKSVSMG